MKGANVRRLEHLSVFAWLISCANIDPVLAFQNCATSRDSTKQRFDTRTPQKARHEGRRRETIETVVGVCIAPKLDKRVSFQ